VQMAAPSPVMTNHPNGLANTGLHHSDERAQHHVQFFFPTIRFAFMHLPGLIAAGRIAYSRGTGSTGRLNGSGPANKALPPSPRLGLDPGAPGLWSARLGPLVGI